MASSYHPELSFSFLLKQKQANKKAPRPLNSFMIYRLEKQHLIFEKCPGINHRDVSKIIAKWWRELPEHEKRSYEAKAFVEKTKHAEMYPNYKYRPKKKQTTRKYRKSKIPATALFTPERINALTELCNTKKEKDQKELLTTTTSKSSGRNSKNSNKSNNNNHSCRSSSSDSNSSISSISSSSSISSNNNIIINNSCNTRLPSIRNDSLLRGIIKSVDAGLDKRFKFPSIDIQDLLLDYSPTSSSSLSSLTSSPSSDDSMDCTDYDRPEPFLPPFIQFPKTPFPASSLF